MLQSRVINWADGPLYEAYLAANDPGRRNKAMVLNVAAMANEVIEMTDLPLRCASILMRGVTIIHLEKTYELAEFSAEVVRRSCVRIVTAPATSPDVGRTALKDTAPDSPPKIDDGIGRVWTGGTIDDFPDYDAAAIQEPAPAVFPAPIAASPAPEPRIQDELEIALCHEFGDPLQIDFSDVNLNVDFNDEPPPPPDEGGYDEPVPEVIVKEVRKRIGKKTAPPDTAILVPQITGTAIEAILEGNQNDGSSRGDEIGTRVKAVTSDDGGVGEYRPLAAPLLEEEVEVAAAERNQRQRVVRQVDEWDEPPPPPEDYEPGRPDEEAEERVYDTVEEDIPADEAVDIHNAVREKFQEKPEFAFGELQLKGRKNAALSFMAAISMHNLGELVLSQEESPEGGPKIARGERWND
jgi:hypothetical protein